MATLRVDLTGLAGANTGLRTFARQIEDLRPAWRQLGEHLADEAQRRWPLRRRTGRLRRSLTWAGDRLGRGGVYEPTPDRLQFGTAVFYSRFFQHGTKQRAATPLIHVDESEHTTQLSTWLRSRAAASGLEVTG